MAESIASDLAGKVLGYIVSAAVERIAPYFGGSDQLEKLQDTMRLIQARLIDAETRQEEEHGVSIKEWLRRLKRVLYKLEDLFEDVKVADHEKQQMGGRMLNNPVCLLTSEFSRLKLNKKVCQDVKAIMRDLESIKSDMAILNLREHPIEHQYVLQRFNDKRETYSYISEKEVIGRENDREVIVEMLLNLDSGECVSIIPIVGIGGLGKTTLAKLCFNDREVEQHFEIKAWACISVICSLKELVTKVLISMFDDHDCYKMNMEELQNRLRRVVNAKRYLLVLDDVWDEGRETWLNLMSLLSSGKQGSKIVVTTRSPIVASAMGVDKPYELQCLSEVDSWNLFESLAFRPEERNPKLTSIGREIVKKCVNVPLAIRSIASLLYCKDTEQEWEHFGNELRMIDQNDIMSTLKLSYDHLPSHLKQCLAYCSLFPKDHKLEKENLIWLWMAQGFIRPFESRSTKDMGDEYFMELLRRCFFQDVSKNNNGSIVSCKMHDLFHDLACKVGDECQLLYMSNEQPRDNWIRHLGFLDLDKIPSLFEVQSWVLSTKQIRSVVLVNEDYGCDTIDLYGRSIFIDLIRFCSRCRYVRALDLRGCEVGTISNSIQKLKHLRYLRLHNYEIGSRFGWKPNCIKGLQNLQILRFDGYGFIHLPKDFNKLTRLRHLIIGEDIEIYMPSKLGELTYIETLSKFVVDENNGLDALGKMEKLAGEIKIEFRRCRENASFEAIEANVKAKKLTSLNLCWSYDKVDADENVLEGLEPPPIVKELTVDGWGGVQFPCWGGGCNNNGFPSLLPNLVSVKIVKCKRCKYLPPLGQLPLLKYLYLHKLTELEYIENRDDDSSTMSSVVYFPSLEVLNLKLLMKLKGWSRSKGGEKGLFKLSKLTIEDCPKLEWIPQVPRIPSFDGLELHGNLVNHLLSYGEEETMSTVSGGLVLSKNFRFCHSKELHCLSINFSSLESLQIEECGDLVSIIAPSPMSLRRLVISGCSRLKDVSAALQHLSVLEELEIKACPELVWGRDSEDKDEDLGKESAFVSSWECLKCLRKLTLSKIKKMEPLFRGLACLTTLEVFSFGGFDDFTTIPESIGHLTQLRELRIWDCPKLSSLPLFFSNLTYLQLLEIIGCNYNLRRRCTNPDGEDWPLIQHIPHVKLYHWPDWLEFDYSQS